MLFLSFNTRSCNIYLRVIAIVGRLKFVKTRFVIMLYEIKAFAEEQ